MDDGDRNDTANRVSAVLSDESENPDLQKTPEQLFDEKIMPKIHDMVMAFGLNFVIEGCRNILSNSDNGSVANRERKVVEVFMAAFNKKQLPFKKWAFFPEAIIADGATDISGAALIFGAIMSQEFGIKIGLTQSDDDQVIVVTYDDERIEYVNFRSELKGKPKTDSVENRVRIVMDKADDVRLQSLPVAEFKRGVILDLLENIRALKNQQIADPKFDDIIKRYSDILDKYNEQNF